MTAYLAVSLAALFAAGLTLYSGFGLGTLLLPVFALFFPAEVAVVATAMVHGANNVFKVSLLGRHADRDVVLKFGLPAIVAAILGAISLGWVAQSGSSMTIEVNEQAIFEITPIKLVIGLLMIGFALFEVLPRFRSMEFERRYLPLGGVLSGFFGGLSGHQGALRSAFLAKTGLSTERFVGSNAVIGFLVEHDGDAWRILLHHVGNGSLVILDPEMSAVARWRADEILQSREIGADVLVACTDKGARIVC